MRQLRKMGSFSEILSMIPGMSRMLPPGFSVDELEDEDLVVPAAMMGAPTVMIEKLPRGDEIVEAFKALEAYLGRSVKAVMCIEAGGLNSTTPFTVASHLGLPVIDGDGMGRAFPQIHMVTLTLHGISATPMTLADH
jgi:Uncharacterized conserved protein